MVTLPAAPACICAATGIALLVWGLRSQDGSASNTQRQKKKAKSASQPCTIPAKELRALRAFLDQVFTLRGWRGGTYHFRTAWASVLADALTEEGGAWQRQFTAAELTSKRVEALAAQIDDVFFGGKLHSSWLDGSLRRAAGAAVTAGAQCSSHAGDAEGQQQQQAQLQQQLQMHTTQPEAQQQQQQQAEQQPCRADEAPPDQLHSKKKHRPKSRLLQHLATQQQQVLQHHENGGAENVAEGAAGATAQRAHQATEQQGQQPQPQQQHLQAPTQCKQQAKLALGQSPPEQQQQQQQQQQNKRVSSKPKRTPQTLSPPQAPSLQPLRYEVIQHTRPSDAWLAYFDETNVVKLNQQRWGARQLSRAEPMNCEGVVCTCRLEALAHTLAHELVHAIVFHAFPEMDAASPAYLADRRHGPIFQLLNRELFGHASDDFHYVVLAPRRGGAAGDD